MITWMCCLGEFARADGLYIVVEETLRGSFLEGAWFELGLTRGGHSAWDWRWREREREREREWPWPAGVECSARG